MDLLRVPPCMAAVNPCGPVYITVGDGGNTEGLSRFFIDEDPQPYCANVTAFAAATLAAQASPSGLASCAALSSLPCTGWPL